MEHPADGVAIATDFDTANKPKPIKTMFYLVAVPSYF